MQYVIKRNNDVVPFNGGKIKAAIFKAMDEVETSIIKETDIDEFIFSISKNFIEPMTVEEIQDEVVEWLMSTDRNLAKHYQSYRAVRHEKRKQGEAIIMQITGMMDGSSAKLSENANKDAKTVPVLRDILAGISSKEYYLNYILPKRIANAHNEFRIHIHDLDYLLFKETNCELIDLARMLKGGCKIGNAYMDEAKSLEVAVGHTVQIIASVSSSTYGGCSVPYLDKTLTPYVRKTFMRHYNNGLKYFENSKFKEVDNEEYFEVTWKQKYIALEKESPKVYNYAKELTEDAVKQSMQGLEYEINSLSTVNGQTPFTTIGIGTETTWEGRLIQKYIFENRAKGFGKNGKKTAIFPKIAYAMAEGHNMNPGDINWDISQLAFKCMCKAVYPDILFVTKEQIKNETVAYPMGCRAFLSPWFDEKGKEIYAGRFNMGATSINLPRIAIKNKGDVQGFYKELDEVLEICRENSLFRAKYLEDTPATMAPILWQSGALAELKPNQTIKDLVWGGYATISIGYIGLSEVSELLFGENFAFSEESYRSTYSIISYIRSKLDYWKKEDNLGYALYSTPSESLCDRFAMADLKEFGPISGITDKEYYDNSFHVSSKLNIGPFDKMKLEGKAHSIASGGHISYIEAPNLITNLTAVHKLILGAHRAGIHYFGINQPIDKCHKCGYEGEFLATERGFECPKCGNHDSTTITVIRRVCGYLAEPDARPFNPGKQKEVINRVEHVKNED